ncbi:hypothetical protein EYF80_038154 [Liparis tanakae]|uniref:Uncharacterized protein n=1 Tax=Liparis tanakae TaxID=230148 RepID=A0A4Z2GDL9_9TELE|nr:hypothetical protein EYF80_038154 [Liparis tanakae]
MQGGERSDHEQPNAPAHQRNTADALHRELRRESPGLSGIFCSDSDACCRRDGARPSPPLVLSRRHNAAAAASSNPIQHHARNATRPLGSVTW